MTQLPLSCPILAPAGSPAAIYLASLAPRSRRVMSDNLKRIAERILGGHDDAYTLPWHLMNKEILINAQKYFSFTYSPAKVNQMMYAVRGALKVAWQMELMSEEEYRDAIDFPMLRENNIPVGRPLDADAIQALFAACDDGTIKGVRDAAILAVLRGGGLKRSEVVNLHIKDYDAGSGKISIAGSKRKEPRRVTLSPEFNNFIRAWITIRSRQPGTLFYPITKGGTIKRHAMRDQSILDIVMERGRQAGIERISPHDFRLTFATHLLKSGIDETTLQKKMGHSNIVTTRGYATHI